jgi:hypothetical protein
MAITEKIISHLPEFYQAQLRRKLLFKVMDVFGMQLQGVENSLPEIIKSHFIDYADQNRALPVDLVKIGALFNVLSRQGEGTEAYCRRLRNYIRLYLGGLGTSDAVIRMAALTFDLDIPRWTYPNGKEIITRPESGFKNKDPFTTLAHLYLPGSAPLFDAAEFDDPDAPFEKSLLIKVIDNPPIPQNFYKGVRHGQNWETVNDSVVDSLLELRLSALISRLKFPVLTNRSTGQVVRFRGIIPKGQVLRIYVREDNTVTADLDGTDVSEFVEAVKGAMFDRDCFDRAYFVGQKVLPMVPKKTSKWHFSVAAAVFGADEIAGGGAWTAIGAFFIDDGVDQSLVPDKDKFAADLNDTTHAKFAVDQRDLFDEASFERLEVGEFDENKCFTDPAAPLAAPVVFAGVPLAETKFNWDAREPASFRVQMNGDELLEVAGLEITGAHFVDTMAAPAPPENRFDTARFALDPRDQLIINVNNIKAAGIKALVVFK